MEKLTGSPFGPSKPIGPWNKFVIKRKLVNKYEAIKKIQRKIEIKENESDSQEC